MPQIRAYPVGIRPHAVGNGYWHVCTRPYVDGERQHIILATGFGKTRPTIYEPDLRLGEFQKVCTDMDPDSVDLILTDPPYGKEFLSLWGDLGKAAKRVLRPGGFLVSYAPHEHILEAGGSLKRHLSFYWLLANRQTGQEPRHWQKHIWIRWKPVLVFYKPPMPDDRDWIHDMIQGRPGKKDLHSWAQGEGEAHYLIKAFSQPGETVLDPMMGSGTTVRMAWLLARKSIGIEKEADSFRIATGVEKWLESQR